MALKDWKKVGDGEWFNKKKNQKIQIYWYIAHPDVTIHLWDFNKNMTNGGMTYIGPKKGFKDLPSAYKFAKQYMRKH
jgi:hypothetical protein